MRRRGRNLLGVPAGAAAVVTNGRVVLAAGAGTGSSLVAEDFLLLEMHAAVAACGEAAVALVSKALDEGRCDLTGRRSNRFQALIQLLAHSTDTPTFWQVRACPKLRRYPTIYSKHQMWQLK